MTTLSGALIRKREREGGEGGVELIREVGITDITVKLRYLLKEYSILRYYTITYRATIDVRFLQCPRRRWYFLVRRRR